MTTTVTRTRPTARTHSVVLELQSDELLPPDYNIGRPFRPEELRLTWLWASDEPRWRLDSALVTGSRLKNDGTRSAQGHGRRSFARRYSTTAEHLTDDAPDWVRDLVDQHEPDQS